MTILKLGADTILDGWVSDDDAWAEAQADIDTFAGQSVDRNLCQFEQGYLSEPSGVMSKVDYEGSSGRWTSARQVTVIRLPVGYATKRPRARALGIF